MTLIRQIVPVKLWCPYCGTRHVDEERNGEKWHRRAHTTHRCQSCGRDWDVYVSGAPDE
jgi:transposase-like protein